MLLLLSLEHRVAIALDIRWMMFFLLHHSNLSFPADALTNAVSDPSAPNVAFLIPHMSSHRRILPCPVQLVFLAYLLAADFFPVRGFKARFHAVKLV